QCSCGQQTTNRLEPTGTAIHVHLSCKMAELMDRHLDAGLLANQITNLCAEPAGGTTTTVLSRKEPRRRAVHKARPESRGVDVEKFGDLVGQLRFDQLGVLGALGIDRKD